MQILNSETKVKELVVYKALFGGYDNIEAINPDLVCENTDYFVISDTDLELPKPWRLIKVCRQFDSHALENRFYKMNGLAEFKKYKYSVYLDGNINLIGHLNRLINTLDSDKDIYAFSHPKRNNVADEFKACVIYNKITLKQYRESNTPKYHAFKNTSVGMFECGILIRQPNSLMLEQAMCEWFDLFKSHIHRDQLYFPYILEKHGLSIGSLGVSNIRQDSEFFSIRAHNRKSRWIDRKKVLLYRKLNKRFKWV